MCCGPGLVKLLRRCLTQLSMRTRSFLDTCVRFEKEAAMQVPEQRALGTQRT